MTFTLSQKSLDTLKGIDPKLIHVVKTAITLSTIDFKVGEGLRTIERQHLLISQGKSKTEKSKHITGDAVDLFAIVDGKVTWDLEHYYNIAIAMQKSANIHNVKIIWGAVWDTNLNNIDNPQKAIEAYVKKRKALGKSAFIDAVHFELVDDK